MTEKCPKCSAELMVTPVGNAVCFKCNYKGMASAESIEEERKKQQEVAREKEQNKAPVYPISNSGIEPSEFRRNQCPKCGEINKFWSREMDDKRKCPACEALFSEEEYELISEGLQPPRSSTVRFSDKSDRATSEVVSISDSKQGAHQTSVNFENADTFVNPENGYTVYTKGFMGLWFFLFGPFYLAYRGLIIESLLLVIAALSFASYGIDEMGAIFGLQLILSFFGAFFIKGYVKKKYATLGWTMKRTL